MSEIPLTVAQTRSTQGLECPCLDCKHELMSECLAVDCQCCANEDQHFLYTGIDPRDLWVDQADSQEAQNAFRFGYGIRLMSRSFWRASSFGRWSTLIINKNRMPPPERKSMTLLRYDMRMIYRRMVALSIYVSLRAHENMTTQLSVDLRRIYVM